MTLIFILNSLALGVGLAMDAFSVSLANGLREPFMSRRRMCSVAGVYAFFQYAMPLAGWFCVRTIAGIFSSFRPFIPWIALFLLLYIGGKMVIEGIRANGKNDEESKPLKLSHGTLLMQGIATSIDALSVGFTIAEYGFFKANAASLIIAAVTFVLCFVALAIGKTAGTLLSGKASLLGGTILIAIGIEIFIKGIL